MITDGLEPGPIVNYITPLLLSGEGDITVVGLPKTELAYDASSKAIDHFDRSSETFILKPDDAFYSPVGYHHYVENLSDFNQYISQS